MERAAELVQRGWCKFVEARDKRGRRVSAVSERAVGWCATGAIVRAIYDVTGRETDSLYYDPLAPALRILWLAANASDGRDIPYWNNTRPNKRPVVDALRSASAVSSAPACSDVTGSLAPSSARPKSDGSAASA